MRPMMKTVDGPDPKVRSIIGVPLTDRPISFPCKSIGAVVGSTATGDGIVGSVSIGGSTGSCFIECSLLLLAHPIATMATASHIPSHISSHILRIMLIPFIFAQSSLRFLNVFGEKLDPQIIAPQFLRRHRGGAAA